MKLLLISANRERSPYPVFPIGLAFLTPRLREAGHQLAALDLCFETDPPAAISAALADHAPDAVVISLRNLDNVTWPDSISYLDALREVVGLCKDRATVIVGGSGYSLMPVEILADCGADYGLVGEGEELLPRLLDCLASAEDPAGLPGVVVPGRATFLAPEPLSCIGTPDRRLFDVARYLKEGGMANLQTKRGCPFSCVYCTYPLLEGERMRLRPVAEIIAELQELVEQHGVDYVYFVDDIFNYPPQFAEQLCQAMIEARLRINWSAFINPGFITTELLALMQQAGCDAVEFGTESGAPTMLHNLGKSFSIEQARAASQLCHDLGLDFAHYLMFGGPGETEQTVLESFRLMDELAPTAVIAMTGIRIYPRTQLEQIALADGSITPDTDLLQPVFYLAPAIRERLAGLVTHEAMQRKNWIVPGLEVNVSPAMLEAMRIFKVRGPLWRMIKGLGRSHQHPLSAAG